MVRSKASSREHASFPFLVLMNRDEKRESVAEADERIVAAERAIAAQIRKVAELERDGHDNSSAGVKLEEFQKTSLRCGRVAKKSERRSAEAASAQKESNDCDQDRQRPETNCSNAKPEIVPHAENVALYFDKHNATD